MPKLVTTDISTFVNDSSAASTYNANLAAIEAAMEKTLSRDGTSPNTMTADLDMNSQDILNAGTISAQDIEIDGTSLASQVTAAEAAATAAQLAETNAESAESAAEAAQAAAVAAQAAAEAARDEAEAIVGDDYVLGVTATNTTIVVDNTDDQNPTIKRAAISGDVTIADGSNTAAITANSVVAGDLKTAFIGDFTEVAVTSSDSFLLGDASDGGNLKRDTVQGILDLVEGNDQVARDMAMTALIASTSTGGIRGPIVSWVANADNFSTKTNATFDTDHYYNRGGQARIPNGTVFGNMTGGGGLAGIYDQNDATLGSIVATTGYHGMDWGVGNSHIVDKFVLHSESASFSGNNGGTATARLYGSNSLPANGTDGTALSNTESLPNVNGTDNTATITTNIDTSTAYRYHWIYHVNSYAELRCSECQLHETSADPDMTLSDDMETITTGADLVDVYVLEKTVDASPTRQIRASIDNGSSWAIGTLSSTYTFADKSLYHYECDVSSQTGTSLKVEYNTLNDGKERNFYRLDAVPLYV